MIVASTHRLHHLFDFSFNSAIHHGPEIPVAQIPSQSPSHPNPNPNPIPIPSHLAPRSLIIRLVFIRRVLPEIHPFNYSPDHHAQ